MVSIIVIDYYLIFQEILYLKSDIIIKLLLTNKVYLITILKEVLKLKFNL